jgi:hypothetical protein
MKQRPAGRPSSSEKIIRDIKRKTRKQDTVSGWFREWTSEGLFCGALLDT